MGSCCYEKDRRYAGRDVDVILGRVLIIGAVNQKRLVRDWEDDLQKVILSLNLVHHSRQRNPRRSRRARPSATGSSTTLRIDAVTVHQSTFRYGE